MKVEASTAEGIALDWAVGQCDKRKLYLAKSKRLMTANYGQFNHRHGAPWYEPSNNWMQGGRIIESNHITVGVTTQHAWWAVQKTIRGEVTTHGHTPLIAAMRCFVASRLTAFELPPDVADAYTAELARLEKYRKQRERWAKEMGAILTEAETGIGKATVA